MQYICDQLLLLYFVCFAYNKELFIQKLEYIIKQKLTLLPRAQNKLFRKRNPQYIIIQVVMKVSLKNVSVLTKNAKN